MVGLIQHILNAGKYDKLGHIDFVGNKTFIIN